MDTQQALRRVGLDVSPSTRLGSLSAGEQQLIEIAKSLALGATVLLLDEPTTSLSERESKRFFDLVHDFAGDGHVVLLITMLLKTSFVTAIVLPYFAMAR